VETELDGDGFFVDLGGIGGEIFLKKDKHETRKRFTLAHELGHYLLRNHLIGNINKDEVEAWCNRFAAELLLPTPILSHHLKSGGMGRLTEKLCEGPKLFQVSEQAFYFRTTWVFPLSILYVILSNSSISVIDVFRSRKLRSIFGTDETVLDSQVETFVLGLAESGAEQQRQLKQLDRTWLARRIYRTSRTQKFLLVVLKR